jgi:hypothetical protein
MSLVISSIDLTGLTYSFITASFLSTQRNRNFSFQIHKTNEVSYRELSIYFWIEMIPTKRNGEIHIVSFPRETKSSLEIDDFILTVY